MKHLENSLKLRQKNLIHRRVTQSHDEGKKEEMSQHGEKIRKAEKRERKRRLKDRMLADQPPGLGRYLESTSRFR